MAYELHASIHILYPHDLGHLKIIMKRVAIYLCEELATSQAPAKCMTGWSYRIALHLFIRSFVCLSVHPNLSHV